uniref:Wsv222-like protein n=1 Tax=Sicyonia whispovirus TaxID=2984283 RepID=A0A9C7BNQ6_9VIRU|nr:MAG: wsv222-like protein [Sicyonia whispovirus]
MADYEHLDYINSPLYKTPSTLLGGQTPIETALVLIRDRQLSDVEVVQKIYQLIASFPLVLWCSFNNVTLWAALCDSGRPEVVRHILTQTTRSRSHGSLEIVPSGDFALDGEGNSLLTSPIGTHEHISLYANCSMINLCRAMSFVDERTGYNFLHLSTDTTAATLLHLYKEFCANVNSELMQLVRLDPDLECKLRETPLQQAIRADDAKRCIYLIFLYGSSWFGSCWEQSDHSAGAESLTYFQLAERCRSWKCKVVLGYARKRMAIESNIPQGDANLGEDGNPICCPVCLELGGEFYELRCKHRIHCVCLMKLSSTSTSYPRCPVCRGDYDKFLVERVPPTIFRYSGLPAPRMPKINSAAHCLQKMCQVVESSSEAARASITNCGWARLVDIGRGGEAAHLAGVRIRIVGGALHSDEADSGASPPPPTNPSPEGVRGLPSLDGATGFPSMEGVNSPLPMERVSDPPTLERASGFPSLERASRFPHYSRTPLPTAAAYTAPHTIATTSATSEPPHRPRRATMAWSNPLPYPHRSARPRNCFRSYLTDFRVPSFSNSSEQDSRRMAIMFCALTEIVAMKVRGVLERAQRDYLERVEPSAVISAAMTVHQGFAENECPRQDFGDRDINDLTKRLNFSGNSFELGPPSYEELFGSARDVLAPGALAPSASKMDLEDQTYNINSSKLSILQKMENDMSLLFVKLNELQVFNAQKLLKLFEYLHNLLSLEVLPNIFHSTAGALASNVCESGMHQGLSELDKKNLTDMFSGWILLCVKERHHRNALQCMKNYIDKSMEEARTPEDRYDLYAMKIRWNGFFNKQSRLRSDMKSRAMSLSGYMQQGMVLGMTGASALMYVLSATCNVLL